ncbi:endo-1,4-beta-xylanase [Alistipes sp. OttesenSCG-928-B03]|nr:endo-1,4-beta-xylanase [Alistipes sp. OttesenSCG-928-B03]
MRKTIFSVSAVLLGLLASCSNEKSFDQNPVGEGEGHIVISAKTNKEVEEIETRANTDQTKFLVEVYNGSTTTSQLLGDGKMTLRVGTYDVTVTSEETYTLPAWNLPVYQGKEEGVVIESKSSQQVSITCTQINAGVKIVFDESVKNNYDNLAVKIENEDSESLSYNYTNEADEDIAYFEPGLLTLSITDQDDNPIKISGETSTQIDVEKKQIWTITLKTSTVLPGEMEIVIVIDDDVESKTPEFGVGEVEGDGSEASPYSVGGAVNAMPAQGVWVEGYIVAPATVTRSAHNAVLIGSTATEDEARCLIMEIPAGSLLAGLTEETAIGTKIKLLGDIAGKGDFTTEAKAIGVISNVINFDNDTRNIGADTTEPITVDGKTLKNITDGSSIFKIGATVKTDNMFSGNPAPAGYMNLLKRDYTSLTLEYEMKMSTQIDLNSGWYDYRTGWLNCLPQFCTENNLAVHGHTLVWYKDYPGYTRNEEGETANSEDWTTLLPGSVKANMATHIQNTMLKYKDLVRSWDVVNEAINNSDGGYWDCIWKTAYGNGEAYVKAAFEKAREVVKGQGLNCKLFYNDYATEIYPHKREAIASMVKKLNEEHAAANDGERLIDGIGLQMHLVAGIDKANIEAAIQAAVDTGCLIHLSEVSVSHAKQEADVPEVVTQEMLDLQLQTYIDLFEAAFRIIPEDKFWGITFWGVNDSTSIYKLRQGMMFDDNYEAKQAYFELINKFGK